MEEPLAVLKFRSPLRIYLEQKGWKYEGSLEYRPNRHIHYYSQDGVVMEGSKAGQVQLHTDRSAPTRLPRGKMPGDIAKMKLSIKRKYQIWRNRLGMCAYCSRRLDLSMSISICPVHLAMKREKARDMRRAEQRYDWARSYKLG